MLALPALRLWPVIDDAAGLGLANYIPRIGLDRLGYRELLFFSFRHGNPEYGILLCGKKAGS